MSGNGNGDKDTSNKGKKAAQSTKSGGCCSCKCFLFIFLATSASVVAVIYQNPDIQQHIGAFLRKHVEEKTLDQISEKCQIYSDIAKQKYQDVVQQISEMINGNERTKRDAGEGSSSEERKNQEKLEAERKAREEEVRLEAEKKAKEEKARLEAEKKAKEEKARLEAEKKAKEEKARLEAERKAKEEAARIEAEKKAKEDKARLEAEKKAKEEAARLEAEKKAKEEKARLEAEKKAKEETARLEAEKKAKEEKARLEAEKKAKEEKARLEAEKKAKEEQARFEAEKKAKEEKARLEAEKKAKEEKARLEAEKKAKEEKARLEAEKKAKEEQARLEAEKKAKEEKARLEAEKKAKEEQARLEAEKKAKEEKARLEAEKKAKEEKTKLEAEKKAKEEKARLEAEKKAKEEQARLEAEKKAKEEKARLEAEKKAKEEQAILEAEKKAKEEKVRLEAEKKAKEEKEAAKYSKSAITSDADYKIKETLDAADDLYDKALASYEKILGKYPKSPRAQYGKGLCLDSLAEEQRSNDLLEDAIGVLQGVIELKSIPDELLIQAGKKLADRQEFRGWGKKAAHTMRFVAERFPNNLALKNQLGVKYLLIGEDENAKQTFKEVLDVDKTNGFAKVHLGFIYKTTDNELEKAIPLLKQGIDSKEPGTEDGRFYFHLGDAYQRVGQKPLAEQVYEEGAKKGLFLSKYQRSLYNVKSLTSRPWWTPEQTKQQLLFKTLEANWEMIRDEGLKQLNPKTGSFMPEEEKLIDKGDWKQFTLYARGKKNQENCAKVPKVCDLIDKFPDAKGCTRGQVKYSVMEPGIHVWPHCGPTNCRLRSHLGLVIPPGPKIRVADEIREWKEGKFIIFDDSFEHEVWHDGNATRLVLIVDFWHPELNTQQKKTLSPI